jgi:ABC-type uncharacterized transport system substrate-binding protein
MQQFGYVEGKNYEIEAYFTGGDRELTQEIARKFVQEPVDILVVIATPAVQIVKDVLNHLIVSCGLRRRASAKADFAAASFPFAA